MGLDEQDRLIVAGEAKNMILWGNDTIPLDTFKIRRSCDPDWVFHNQHLSTLF